MKGKRYWKILNSYKEMSNGVSSKICSIVENVLTIRDLFVEDLPCNIGLKPAKTAVKMYRKCDYPFIKTINILKL